MQDAWRAYLELALGLTEASRRRAEKVARDLLDRGGATAGQVQSFVEELMSTSRANREELAKLVRYEVDRALGAVGLATAEETTQLSDRVTALERRLRESEQARLPEPVAGAVTGRPGKAPGKQVAKKTTKAAGSTGAAKATKATKATKTTKAGKPATGTGGEPGTGKRAG